MYLMKKIPYSVEINIASVPTRNCRYFQEQIYEYNDDGRARFQWDKIRQEYIMGKNDVIEEICQSCPLNILLEVEGCRGQLYEFEIFMRMLPYVKPDSILLTKKIINSSFNQDETEILVSEMEQLQEAGQNISWPIAQVFIEDEEVFMDESLKYDNLVYYEWSGDEEQIYFESNKGYYIGIIQDGIVLKKNFGETIPKTFLSITRKGRRVIGKTIEGDIVPIPPNRTALPEWLPEVPGADTTLKFTSLPISNVFQDVFNMLIIFGKLAVNNFTGISIFSKFYRRF